MFACIHWRNIPKSNALTSPQEENPPTVLVDLAFEFSPLVEHTSADIVVLDVSGQHFLFGAPNEEQAQADKVKSAHNLANAIARRGRAVNLKINVAVAPNADTAIHAARSFKGVTITQEGEELSRLASLSIKTINYSSIGVTPKRNEEIQETFALWGIRTFADLAALPLSGVAERLGPEGVWLQKLAQGKTSRNLRLVRPAIGFEKSIELEHPIEELEPLSFILSRLLNQLCANLHEYALATNELKSEMKLEDRTEYLRAITLPVPMRNPKTLLRLILFEIEREPPTAPIIAVTVSAEPVKPGASQTGLFVPLAPAPEKLEITLARLAKLVGTDNVGSPEILDTHRPDTFRMKKFSLPTGRKKARSNPQTANRNSQSVMGFRIFRPPWRADVRTQHGKPTRISARSEETASTVRGTVVCAAGPWRASGDWWRDVWARDEWDVSVIDPNLSESEVLCRIYRDLTTEQWFVAGIYD